MTETVSSHLERDIRPKSGHVKSTQEVDGSWTYPNSQEVLEEAAYGTFSEGVYRY
jgi:hypothetical protein